MATPKPIIIKRYNGTDYDPLYPKVTTQEIFTADGATKIFDTNNIIYADYLPSYVIGGMKFVGTIALSGTATQLDALGLTTSELTVGNYVIVTTAGKLDSYKLVNTVPSITYQIASAAESDEGQSGDPIDLEAGDWIVLTDYTVDGSGNIVAKFAIVNNTYRLATTAVDGLMSSSDKTKLDGVAANANNYVHPSYTTRSVDTTGVDVLDTFTSDSTGHVTGIATRTLPNATTSTAGVMSAADKTKLDGIAANANNYTLPLATTTTLGGIEVGYTSTETNRAVILSGNDAYVNLPRQIPAVTLNGASSTSPSFYAPTGSGLAPTASTQSRQFLQAAGNTTAPTWVDHVRINYYTDEASSTAAGVFLGDILFEF